MSGEMKTLVENPNQDCLTPQMSADGVLFYIRRPYTTGSEFRPLRWLKDLAFFPFRLLYAVFQYLQFFSMMYTGKKLTSAGGARSPQMDLKDMLIWGSRVSAGQAVRDGDEAPDLVPGSWHLVRQRPGYDAEVLAKGVLAYDLAPDGSVVYSNGSAIFLLDPTGKTERIHVERLIEQVTVLP
jgi:hypothetical protein